MNWNEIGSPHFIVFLRVFDEIERPPHRLISLFPKSFQWNGDAIGVPWGRLISLFPQGFSMELGHHGFTPFHRFPKGFQ